MTVNEEELKEKYMEFQLIQKQIEQISEQVGTLHQQNNELDLSINALNDLDKTKLNSEILAPIADGIFVKAELKDKKLIVNVGANTTVERIIPEVITLLEKQKEEITKNTGEAEQVLEKFTQRAMKIYQEVEEKTDQS